jgi:hypothetical protein
MSFWGLRNIFFRSQMCSYSKWQQQAGGIGAKIIQNVFKHIRHYGLFFRQTKIFSGRQQFKSSPSPPPPPPPPPPVDNFDNFRQHWQFSDNFREHWQFPTGLNNRGAMAPPWPPRPRRHCLVCGALCGNVYSPLEPDLFNLKSILSGSGKFFLHLEVLYSVCFTL